MRTSSRSPSRTSTSAPRASPATWSCPLDVDGFEGTSEGCVEDQDAATLQAIIDDQSGYYVNIHTADFPAGAIRGQLVGASEPPNTALPVSDGSPALLGAILLALAAAIGLRTWRPVVTRD